MGKKSQKNRKNGSKIGFRANFPIFLAIFSPFSGRGQNRFFGDFFPISGRRPEIGILPGTHTRNPSKTFSLRSCRSSSVNFFDFSEGNLGNLTGILAGIFLTPRIKAQKFRGKFRGIFVRKFVAQKKSFVQNSLCRRATLRKTPIIITCERFRESPQTIVAHECGDPLSRYTCRSRLAFFRCSSGVALHPLLKSPVAPVALQLPGLSHVKLPLKRCRTTGVCSSYTCRCRATLCNYASNLQFITFRPPKARFAKQGFSSGTLKWATPPVRLVLSGRNSGKIRERPRKRSQSVSWNSPREYGWGAPNPYNSRHLRLPERFQDSLPPSTAGDASFFRIGSGEGLSELVMEFPAVLGAFLMI